MHPHPNPAAAPAAPAFPAPATSFTSSTSAASVTAPDPALPASNPFFPLPELADFFTGYPMRSARKATAEKVWLIEAQDLADGQLKPELNQAVIANLPPQQALQAGDILLSKTAAGYVPVLLQAPLPRTVAAAPLWVIRPHDPTRLHPAYLAWYLQTRHAQRALAYLHGQAASATCTREGLRTLRIWLPAPAHQHALVRIAANLAAGAQKAYELWQQMLAHNEKYLLTLAEMPGAMPEEADANPVGA